MDNTRQDPYQDLKFYTGAFKEFIDEQQMVVGVTRMDLKRTPNIDDYRKWLDELGYSAPIFEVDARSRKDVSVLIQGLLLSLDPGVS
jgi:signal recognition particle receptor subunit beta